MHSKFFFTNKKAKSLWNNTICNHFSGSGSGLDILKGDEFKGDVTLYRFAPFFFFSISTRFAPYRCGEKCIAVRDSI